MKNKTVVFCDTTNKIIDKEYAEKVIISFRKFTGWQVLKGTPISKALKNFSKGYSVKKRNTDEVAQIFMIAHGIN